MPLWQVVIRHYTAKYLWPTFHFNFHTNFHLHLYIHFYLHLHFYFHFYLHFYLQFYIHFDTFRVSCGVSSCSIRIAFNCSLNCSTKWTLCILFRRNCRFYSNIISTYHHRQHQQHHCHHQINVGDSIYVLQVSICPTNILPPVSLTWVTQILTLSSFHCSLVKRAAGIYLLEVEWRGRIVISVVKPAKGFLTGKFSHRNSTCSSRITHHKIIIYTIVCQMCKYNHQNSWIYWVGSSHHSIVGIYYNCFLSCLSCFCGRASSFNT